MGGGETDVMQRLGVQGELGLAGQRLDKILGKARTVQLSKMKGIGNMGRKDDNLEARSEREIGVCEGRNWDLLSKKTEAQAKDLDEGSESGEDGEHMGNHSRGKGNKK